jgi:hypothetical protein
MTFLEQCKLSHTVTRAMYAIHVSQSPFTSEIMKQIYAEQAESILQSIFEKDDKQD